MTELTQIIHFELWLLLGGLALVVGYQLLTGRINMQGLLDDKVSRKPSPGRVQLLVFTVAGAGYYILLTLENAASGLLPPIPAEMLWLVGGSQLAYLGGKARSHLFR